MNYAEIAEISPSPLLVSYWTVKGPQAVMPPLQADGREHDALNACVSATDNSRRHNVKRAHDGGEEGEGRKRDELHDWGVRGYSLGESGEKETGQSRVFI